MSRDSTLSVSCSKGPIDVAKIKNIIETFLLNGWSIYQNGSTCILPVGDADRYEWTDVPVQDFGMEKYLNDKYRLQEPIGFHLINNNTTDGFVILFIFEPMNKWNIFTIIFDLGFARRDTKHGNTDISWYLDNIFHVLRNSDLDIISYDIKEIM